MARTRPGGETGKAGGARAWNSASPRRGPRRSGRDGGERGSRSSRAVAWLTVIFYAAGISTTYLLERGAGLREENSLEDAVILTGFAAVAAVGALLVAKRPSAYGLCNSVVALGYCYAAYGIVVDPGALPSPLMIGTLATGVGWTASKILTPFLFLLFPTGRLPSRRWRPFARVLVAVGALLESGP
jgi:hypothetical protein